MSDKSKKFLEGSKKEKASVVNELQRQSQIQQYIDGNDKLFQNDENEKSPKFV